MASVPLVGRLVEVIADRGESAAERYRWGSGCIIVGRTVLTAAHVVAGAQSVQVRDPDKKLYSATVDPGFVGDANGPGPDLALLEIDDPAVDLPPIGLARVDRDGSTDGPVERCHAIGYPAFAETDSPAPVRDTVHAIGVVPSLSKLATGLLSVLVSISPRPLPPKDKSLEESEWSGMSGAPVVAAGRLLGVVTEHAPREGPSAITAVPLTALEQDPAHPGWGPGVDDPPAWWARLGVSGLADLQSLPVVPERSRPAYWETVREFGWTLHRRMPQLLGRERELAEIAAFATGPAGYRWLVGGAYTGKTALLYEAVTAGLPDEVDVVCYFLSRRASDADSSRFLAAVVPQLAYLCELDSPVADRDQFYALWGRATRRAAEAGRPLLLAVDGLDEDIRPAGLPSVASLLPTLVDRRAHVLLTSRPHPELPGDVPDRHPLKSPSIRMDLTPFEGAQELAELARQEIDKLTHDADADTAVDALGLLTAAAGPLSEEDLAYLSNDLAAPSAAHSRRVYRLVSEQVARSLELVGPAEHPRYQFAHLSLLEYAQATKELSHPEYRKQIHRWAEWWRHRGWPISPDATKSTPRYLLDSYPGTLADEPSRLVALASDAGWVDAAIQLMGADRVLADLERARDLAEGLDDTENLARVSLLAAGCHYNLGRVSAAARTYQKVLVSVRQLLKTPAIEVDGFRGIKAAAHLGLGLCFTDQGQFQKAEFNYTSARVLLRELDEPRLQVQLQAQWGRLHIERGYSALAIEHLDAGLAIAMQPSVGYRMGQGECLISKAKALIDLDENQKAVELARTAARIGSDISNGALVRDGNYVEALALLCDDELERAQIAIDATCRTIDDPVRHRAFHSAFALQGVIALRRRDYSGAMEAFGTARTRARNAANTNKRDYLAWDSLGLAEAGYLLVIPHTPGELRQAVEFYRRARHYCSERGAIAHAMRLLGRLPDPKGLLADVRRAASEPYRRNASGSR